MSNNISLAIYQLSINVHGQKESNVVLSDFNNGTDALDLVYDMLDSMRYSSSDLEVSTKKDKENYFRIMKDMGKDVLYKDGRTISGIIESGSYGTEENVVNVDTGVTTHKKRSNEALLVPFYFQFQIPRDSNFGFLILERISGAGIYRLLESRIKQYIGSRIRGSGNNGFVLRIRPLVLKKLVKKHLCAIEGGARKIVFEQVKKDDLMISQLTGKKITNEKVGNTQIVYTAKRKSWFNISGFYNSIAKRESSNVYVVDDIEYSDVKFEVVLHGSPRLFSIREIDRVGTFMDISDLIDYAQSKYPTFHSLNKEAHKLASYIFEEIFGENKSCD